MDSLKSNKNVQLSRRNFLKAAAGSAAGILVMGTAANKVSAAEQNSEPAINPNGEESGSYIFTDSLGRKVLLPTKIERVVPSGIYAQAVLCTLCPEKIASIKEKIDESEKEQYGRAGREEVCELPETGGIYSCHERDVKTSKISSMESELIIDIGCKKDDLKFSLDYLQMNTNTITIFIDASFGNLPETYRILGEVLNCEDRGERLAVYIENLYAEIRKKGKNVETASRILFAGNELGLSMHSDYSFPNKAIEFVGGTPVIMPDSGVKNKMDESSLQNQSIDYVIFNSRDCFDSVLNAQGQAYEIWTSVPAILEGRYATAPALFHSWFNSPLLTQIIGLPWVGNLIWPSIYDYDMIKTAQEFYDLFYGYGLSDDEAVLLLGY